MTKKPAPVAPPKLTKLIKRLNDLKAELEQLSDLQKKLTAEKEDLEKNQIPKIMEDSEQDKVSITGVGTVYLQGDVQVYVKIEDQSKTYDWLKKNGHGDIVKETVHPGTLKSWSKEQLENGGELPPGLNVHQYLRAVLRRK